MPRAVKRTYDTSRRRQQAEATRRHVIDTAMPLFIEYGYEATSMRLVADAAGVSLQTLYNAFESKFGLFSAGVDVIIAGDHEPVAVADRPAMRALDTINDPPAFILAMVESATPILARFAAIYPTLRAAAASDEQIAAANKAFTLDGRYADYRKMVARLGKLGALKMPVKKSTDVAWTVLSPDAFDLFISHRGWSVAEFESWAVEALTATLLG